MKVFYAFVILCLSGSAMAQIYGYGACRRVEGQKNFDLPEFMGHWWVPERYSALFQLKSRCHQVEFVDRHNGTVQGLNNIISGFTGKDDSFVVTFQTNPANLAHLRVKLPLTPLDATTDCWIAGTDYDNYGVMYCCTSYKAAHLKWAWVLTRDRLPERSVLTSAYEVFDNNRIDRRLLWKTDMRRCPAAASYYD